MVGLRLGLPSKKAEHCGGLLTMATMSVSSCRLCLLFIHPRAPNLISLRSAGTMPA